MDVNLPMNSVNDCLPPNKSWVVAIIQDTISKKKIVRSGYFENGTFWESASSQASGLEHSSRMIGQPMKEDWQVISWCSDKVL